MRHELDHNHNLTLVSKPVFTVSVHTPFSPSSSKHANWYRLFLFLKYAYTEFDQGNLKSWIGLDLGALRTGSCADFPSADS